MLANHCVTTIELVKTKADIWELPGRVSSSRAVQIKMHTYTKLVSASPAPVGQLYVIRSVQTGKLSPQSHIFVIRQNRLERIALFTWTRLIHRQVKQPIEILPPLTRSTRLLEDGASVSELLLQEDHGVSLSLLGLLDRFLIVSQQSGFQVQTPRIRRCMGASPGVEPEQAIRLQAGRQPTLRDAHVSRRPRSRTWLWKPMTPVALATYRPCSVRLSSSR